MDSCAKARSQMPMRGTGTRAMKPGHVGRYCLDNYPENAVQRCATLVVIALLGLGALQRRNSGKFLPASPASRCIPTLWQPLATANDFTRSKWSLSAAPFIVIAACHRRCTAIFSALLPRPNSTMRMCAGIFHRSMSNRHELNGRSHQRGKKGHLFRDARDSDWSGGEGISERSYGKWQRRTAWLE